MKKILIKRCIDCPRMGVELRNSCLRPITDINYIPEDCPLPEDLPESKDEDYEPYFGWCDVEGCDREGCSGGNAWRETGYWTVCPVHAEDCRKGLPQPKMKQSAIDRENSRDPITHCLPAHPTDQK